jgi:hypothetical protein
LGSGAGVKKYGGAEVSEDSGGVPGCPGIGATPYHMSFPKPKVNPHQGKGVHFKPIRALTPAGKLVCEFN